MASNPDPHPESTARKPVLNYGIDPGVPDWKRELARDFLACGSWVFYILILGRAMIAPYRPFTDHLIIAAAIYLAIVYFFKGFDGYLARAIILLTALIPFYADVGFSIFVIAAFLGLCLSTWYLGSDWKRILAGLLVGAVSIGVAFAVAPLTQQQIFPDLGRIPAHREAIAPDDSAYFTYSIRPANPSMFTPTRPGK